MYSASIIFFCKQNLLFTHSLYLCTVFIGEEKAFYFFACFFLGDYEFSFPSFPWNSRAHILNIPYRFCRQKISYLLVYTCIRALVGKTLFILVFIGKKQILLYNIPSREKRHFVY